MRAQIPHITHTSFRDEADMQRRAVQAAFTDLLAGAGVSGVRPTELGRRLGLDKTLAWKISRLVESEEPADAFRHLPGPGGVEILLRAAEDRRVQEDLVRRVRRACEDLQTFVERHAGDRRTFEAMLAGRSPDPRGEVDERRAYFRAGSAIWGVRTRMQFLMLALRPSETRAGYLDVAQISGLVDLERLQPDVPWIVRRLRAHSDSGAPVSPVRRVPLVAERAEQGLPPLFDRYCSSPLPQLRQFERAGGWVYDELVPGPVGRAGATTVVLGERYIGALPLERDADNAFGEYALTIRTPCECVMFDLLLHRDLVQYGRPNRVVFGLLEDGPLAGTPGARGETRSRLMAPAPALELGAPAVVHTSRLAAYPSMVTDALGLAGFEGLDAFRGYRTEIEYPAFPSDVRMYLEIGERTAGASGAAQ